MSAVLVGILLVLLATFLLFRQVAVKRSLRELAQRLTDGTFTPPRWFSSRFNGLSVRGKLEGRTVVVAYDGASYQESRQDFLSFAVSVANPACRFELAPADLLSRLGKWLGLGAADHPARFDVEARSGRQALGALLTREDVVALLDRLVGTHGCDRVSLKHGSLVARRPFYRTLAKDSAFELVEDLARLARMCDRRKLAGGLRFGWTAGGGEVLCPYCRDVIDEAQDEQLTACPRCQTVHHAECYTEAGDCTIFGCSWTYGPRTSHKRFA